jgi:Icc-related predicted phosphoesterase
MVVDRLYSANVATNLSDVDLILGCGDLPYEYLEFLATAVNIPLLYVPGNHDPRYDERNPATHAEGCDYLDLQVMRVKGLNIAGLGGSIRYKPSHPNQYTQSEMYSRILRFTPKLISHLLKNGRILDITIAHSPPRGVHDDNDAAHIGFTALNDFIRVFKPRYLLHGHTMVYKSNLVPPVTQVGATTVINVYPYRIFEVEP